MSQRVDNWRRRGVPEIEYNLAVGAQNFDLREFLGNDAPSHIRLKVSGNSMYPTLKPGDVVVIEYKRVESGASLKPEAGALLLYQLPGAPPITHRFIATKAGMLITRGDARPSLDPPIPPSAVLGQVVAIERGTRVLSLETNGRRLLAGQLAWLGARCFAGLPWLFFRLAVHLAVRE